MSMKTRWQDGNEQREMTSPLSLVISAFAPRGRRASHPYAAAVNGR
ncbi:phosphoribosylformylglycinamidine synthase [Salmonella enterica subsp. enterica]|uniref:Phosphoribosylformylglycinamidine synthase n=1 Tax=Salmonella enterica I TaxID=59201 RepID=A0A379WNI3_SALET|nr:phosphoribosylformylglycinamidine synthase [Salmonella enterica subsp. enterica]